MRIFVTGATGWVGSAVVRELLKNGHKVLGLARSDSGAQALEAAGAEVQRGDLEDLESLRKGAAWSEGVVHCAFIHDFSTFDKNCAVDRTAIETIGEVLAGTNRPFIISSGTAGAVPGTVATEDSAADPNSPLKVRKLSETLVLSLVSKGVKSMVLRLPPTVHGDGDKGFVPSIVSVAKAKGVSAYIAEGRNRWPAVHRLDAAHLYRLALEKGEGGKVYHAVHDEGVPTKEIAEVIGKHLAVPVKSKPAAEAAEHFGFLGHFYGMDCPASSAKTREQLGWAPKHQSLIADLDEGHYFSNIALVAKYA
jgi:nucleoside-diphosphate-sugar epimerase